MLPSSQDPIPALKRQLADAIVERVGQTNQHVAASMLGIGQPRMSELLRRRLANFSLQKLIRLLAILDHRVELKVTNEGWPVLRPWVQLKATAARKRAARRQARHR